VDAKSGRTLYDRASGRLMTPASNTKLFSTAMALTLLGPGHRFHTSVRAQTLPDSSGAIRGDLELTGGGDPTLSGRTLPYDKDAADGDSLAVIESLPDEVVRAGVRRVDGNIVGDDTNWIWEPYPDGWTIDDAIWYYGAPVSALVVNDNSLTITLTPAPAAEEPAMLTLSPPIGYFAIHNRVQTVASGMRRVEFERLPGSRELHVWGTLPLGDRLLKQSVACGDPAEFAAELLYDALIRKGVAVSGRAVARHRRAYEPPPKQGPVKLAERESPPLCQIITMINKVSQNLHAEMLLREVARFAGRAPLSRADWNNSRPS
jgi:D-alanyl-D-alanine carboxypeptidase/D-alanyl-D-alanine-endopeptidase (penicillin-binding protein 4)